MNENNRINTSAYENATEQTTDLTATRTADLTTTAATTPTDKIEVVEEQIAVGKREVEQGGVRVHSVVTEQPVTEQVHLREERVEVERHPVDRPVGSANAFREELIEARETAEVPVVAKEARVVEEISLNKTATERVETIQDTVRRTDVEVENIGTTTERTIDVDRR